MAKVTWLGEDENDVAGPSFTTWQGMKFDKDKPVDITDMGILNKAKGNRFFKVEGGPGRPPKTFGEKVKADGDEEARIDLVYQALEVLGILAAGQTPAAEDFAAVDEHLDPLIATLSARNIVTVDDADRIPMEWYLSLGVLLADRAADTFGLPALPNTPGNPNPVDAAEAELREVTYGRPTFEPLRADYY